MNLPLTVLPPLWRNDRLAPLLSPYFLHLSFETEIYLAIKGRHKEWLESLASSRSQRARAGLLDKGLWRRRGADGQGTTGKAFSPHAQKHALTQDVIFVAWRSSVNACVRACTPLPSSTSPHPPPLSLLFPFTRMQRRTCAHSLPFLVRRC